MIDANNIKLDKRFERYFEKSVENELNKLECLKPISKINIFVGANNSGKSMFMRLLSSKKEFHVHAKSVDGLEAKIKELLPSHNQILELLRDVKTIQFGSTLINSLELNKLKKMFEGDFIPSEESLSSYSSNFLGELKKTYRSLGEIRDYASLDKQNGNSSYQSQMNPSQTQTLRHDASQAETIIDSILDEVKDRSFTKADTIYIPVLRGLRPLDSNFTDFYKDTTEKDYFTDIDEKPNIFTGLNFYTELTHLLLGNNEKRRLVQEYQRFISKELFEGKDVELIPSPEKQTVTVKIGDEKDLEIHLLGDGIQSAIILTFLPFITKEPTYFFIEEPEIYLHPGLQRKILEFFDKAEKCKNHKFFMTTHSNHFLDITIDIKEVSIFTFRKQLENNEESEKEAKFIVEAVDGACHSSLELLGVRNSSVFLVNATIWVEGITDRWYLRKMLESYIELIGVKKLEEDVHYCFVEYGGSNITHWSFLNREEHPIVVERLCAKAMVIVDDDGGKKEERKKELLKTLTKDNLIVLPCREIENLLPYQILKEVVIDYEIKKKNTKLQIKDFTYNDYKDEYLGKFIEEVMLENKNNKKYRDKNKSDTIANKRDFCERVLEKIEYSILPKTTQEIVKKIHKFIVEQNS